MAIESVTPIVHFATMATEETKRLLCRCEECGHRWTSRTDKVPYQCPRCLKRVQHWNKSEEKRKSS